MKHFLMNLSDEMPYLIVLGACYIIMDRVMFSGKLSRLIRDGWAARLRRLWRQILRRVGRQSAKMLPLRPADPRKILTTVAWDEGPAGHTGELSPKHEDSAAGNDSFVPASKTDRDDGVVSREERAQVFADSRLAEVRTAKDTEEWIEPVSPDENDTGGAYSGPDDDDDSSYGEMNAAFDYAVGREQTPQERDLALRAFRNLRGTPTLAGIERMTERINEKIKTSVKETFADVMPKDRPLDGFKLGDYM